VILGFLPAIMAAPALPTATVSAAPPIFPVRPHSAVAATAFFTVAPISRFPPIGLRTPFLHVFLPDLGTPSISRSDRPGIDISSGIGKTRGEQTPSVSRYV
jgi:hypothetical protein